MHEHASWGASLTGESHCYAYQLGRRACHGHDAEDQYKKGHFSEAAANGALPAPHAASSGCTAFRGRHVPLLSRQVNRTGDVRDTHCSQLVNAGLPSDGTAVLPDLVPPAAANCPDLEPASRPACTQCVKAVMCRITVLDGTVASV